MKYINIKVNKVFLSIFLWVYFFSTLTVILYSFIITDRININENQFIDFDRIYEHTFNKFINCDRSDGHNDKYDVKERLRSAKHLRRAHTTSQELFNYLSITLNKSQSFDRKLKNTILQEVSDLKNVIQLEIEQASTSLNINIFKQNRLKQIARKIQTKIEILQNPPKQLCSKVPKLICKLHVDAGFASGIHEVLWCLLSAYHQNKTVILIPDWTKYFARSHDVWERIFLTIFTQSSRESWNSIFIPLSKTCNYTELPSDQLSEEDRPNNVIDRKLINYLPKSFGPELVDLIDSPNSWFHSQFVGYIMRPQPRLELFIEKFKKEINFVHPIVGIQVRRSDKLTYKEALYHPLSDYMIHVEDYFNKLGLTQKLPQRVVYVASDDPSVLSTLIVDYPKYRFIGSTSIAEIALSQTTRYSNVSLWGVLTDVYLLSQTDYIVCTFSSAICRLSYELMRYKQFDASFSFRSLDVPFHYHHSLTPMKTALYNHWPKSSDQWQVGIGDHFYEKIRGRHTEWFDQSINGRGWDTYFYASNTSSHQKFYKLYPNYKVFDDIALT